MKAFYILILCCIGLESHANPFSENSSRGLLQSECKYSEVYSASGETYLMLNLLESLAFLKAELKNDLKGTLVQASKRTAEVCSNEGLLALVDPKFEYDKLIFGFGAGLHSLEWVEKRGSLYLVYTKLYGTYKNEPLYVAKFKKGVKESVRITGRLGAEQSNQRYTFFYKSNEKSFSQKFKLNNKSFKDFKSLKSIYKMVPEKKSPVVKVGVIGTGVDYNHPGMAQHLAYRFEMEKGLQKLETLEKSLRSSFFISQENYEKKNKEYQTLKKAVGFPKWMDQAMGTRTPYDAVIINQKISLGGTREHETRVASRIVRTGGPVEIHFARRSMGSSMDILNVKKVIREFVDKGVSLVNLSFGSKCGALPLEEQQWDEVFADYKNVVFVVSAGNSGFNTEVTPFCPAVFSKKYKNVISVTALSDDGLLAVYFDTPVNFGIAVDLAIKSDNLEVLVPFRSVEKWENNANGATSLAAAEVSRILTEAKLEGLNWSAQTVKSLLVNTSLKRPALEGVNATGSEVDEWAFRAALKKSK